MNIKRIGLLFWGCLIAINLLLTGCGSGGGGSTEAANDSLFQGSLDGVYIPPDCENQPITKYTPSVTPPAPQTNPLIKKEDELAVCKALTDTITRVYLYDDFNGVDWPGVVDSYRIQMENGLETEVFYNRMDELVSELGDDHSHFESPAEVAASAAELAGANDYVGIGVLVKPLLNKNSLTILSIFPGSAAEHGALKPHDSLLAVDGVALVENGIPYPHRVRGPFNPRRRRSEKSHWYAILSHPGSR